MDPDRRQLAKIGQLIGRQESGDEFRRGLSVKQRRFSLSLGPEPAEGNSAAGIAAGSVALALALVTGSAALECNGLVLAHAIDPKVTPTSSEGRRKNANTKRVWKMNCTVPCTARAVGLIMLPVLITGNHAPEDCRPAGAL